MIGLILIGVFGLWVWLALYLGLKIPKWLNLKRRWPVTVPIVAFMVLSPFADNWVGKYQYDQLCANHSNGQAATSNQTYTTLTPIINAKIEITGVARPTHISIQQFVEGSGQKVVRSDRAVWQTDGWILRWLGLAGQHHCSSTSIWNISPQEDAARINRSWASKPVQQQFKSTVKELPSVLQKFDISRE